MSWDVIWVTISLSISTLYTSSRTPGSHCLLGWCIPASGTAPASSCYLSPQRHYSLMFCPNLHLCHFQQSVYITGMVYVHSILMANHKSIHVHLHCLATLALPGYTWQHSQCIWTGLMSLFKDNLFKLQKQQQKKSHFSVIFVQLLPHTRTCYWLVTQDYTCLPIR